MSSYSTILYSLSGDVATLTLNRPDRMNAITPLLIEETMDAIDAASSNGARALVLTAAGRCFCAGLDLLDAKERRKGGAATQLIDTHFHPLARKLAGLSIPIITAINGAAVGAGLSLALSGDIIVAAKSAYLLCAFVSIGAVPDTGATWLLTKSLGRARALEMMLLGDRVPADTALAYGLINRVVDDENVLSEACALASKLATGPTVAIGLIRKQVSAALAATFDATLNFESDHQKIAKQSPDFDEAIAAFAEKRRPVFQGR